MKALQTINLSIPPVRPAQATALPLQTSVAPLNVTTSADSILSGELLSTIISFMLIMMIMKMMMGAMGGMSMSTKSIKY